ncbi:hypothetical protein PBI_SCTP2_265 [Salicola phage SCTP-2]|nr:hypothetical protein PBI_SCTP2_265 [Salicola phage SCTP-2]
MIKCIGCFIYDMSKDMFLLQQRSKKCTHPYKWGIWGGKLNKNENFGEALQREIKEELGSSPEIVKLYPLDTFLSDDDEFIYYSFVMVVDEFNDIVINENETNDYIWLPYKYLTRLDLHPGVDQTIQEKHQAIKDIISKHQAIT